MNALPMYIEAGDDKVLMSFGDSIDVDECEDETFLRTMWASCNSGKIVFQSDVRHVLTMEIRDILYRLLISLFDDFCKYIRDDFKDVIGLNNACSI